ncbi:hypothetical protein [Flavobacterium sp. NKUCC04_CG]|uniref:hypothetical protein n=1 Tax=Flavobacterium sp. NKUCC04_CG TaxID=2842121 RepID=UPI001C5B6464|nr:hypothetical protein [Flavobacterium sp. NKUCC04_CG]MBW3519641.1 hypothetical protein [Flavobacterium sp. NKUCC04_CG]
MQNFITERQKVFHFLVLFILSLCFSTEIEAQEAQAKRTTSIVYRLATRSSAFIPLNDGVVVNSLATDEAVSAALPIGFTFTIGCANFTSFYASSNGTISFNNAVLSNIPAIHHDTPILAPLWTDLSGVDGVFSYSTTGVAPNRVLTAEWKNWGWNSQTRNVISFQVKIYERTNVVEYLYDRELNPIGGGPAYNAAIGLYNNDGAEMIAQLWLSSDAVANPTTSTTLSRPVASKPQSGQLYRFTAVGECPYYGQTLMNPTGGRTETGLRISLSGTGTMQIFRRNTGQIYPTNKDIIYGTTNPTLPPGTVNGFVLTVGNTAFIGGSVFPATGSVQRPKLEMISSTPQHLIESPQGSGNFINIIKLYARKGSLTYYLDVKYTYRNPDNSFLIDYTVTIPAGNTEPVNFAHGFDTYLERGDTGPGFVLGTAPDFVMGVKKLPSYEAFHFKGGVPWSGYFSGFFHIMNNRLGAAVPPYMVFDNYIDTHVDTDNAIAISIAFGSTPGAYVSSNAIVFSCEAGDNAPSLTGTLVKPCKGAAFNLNDYLVNLPPFGVKAVWERNGVEVADPTNVTIEGTYTVYFYSSLYDCESPKATLEVQYDPTCEICYKPAVTTGSSEPALTIISTLDRHAVPRDLSDYRTGNLILESKTQGLVLTRMASPETTITDPVEGMLVYDTVNNVIKLYNGTIWKELVQSCPND